jgi:uncharacterized membrane protein
MSDIAGEDIPRRWTTSQVEAFSDGVFAIAITLPVHAAEVRRRGAAESRLT